MSEVICKAIHGDRFSGLFSRDFAWEHGVMCRLSIFFVAAISCLFSPPLHAGETGKSILNSRCVSCHNLKGPAPVTLAALWKRKGPDLFYAGNKYKHDWLVSWLQKPERIRPAGMFYRDHIKPGPKHDVVDASTLKPHVSLNKRDATAVADALMTFKANSNLVASEKLIPAPSPIGEMMFDKIYGCMACHQIEPGYGGMSGSEAYTAGKRLQASFMLSYIKNPQAWDPKIWMPNKHVPADNIQQLVNYLIDLSKEDFSDEQ